MKHRYRKLLRGKVWWCHDNQTGKRESLETRSEHDASRLIDQRNQPYVNAGFHQQMARTHLLVSDAKSPTRTWQHVMDAIIGQKTGNTKTRWERAAKSKSFDAIRHQVIVNTKAEDFHKILNDGKVSSNVFLRRIHNFAQDMNWLLAPVIAKRSWPTVKYGEKRAITLAEHLRIIEREKNPERKAFYEVCWHIGGSQSDMAGLKAENIDWKTRILTYQRMKSKEWAQITIGPELEKVLRSRPSIGALFPYLATVREADRATEFRQRCKGLGIFGVTLHSFRYSWAERSRSCGYPERFAQQALGHGSKAVHRAYSKHAEVILPALETYEANIRTHRPRRKWF